MSATSSLERVTMPGSYGRRRSSSICTSDLQAAAHNISLRRTSHSVVVPQRLHGRRRSSSICLTDIMAASRNSSKFWDSVKHVVTATGTVVRTTQHWRGSGPAQSQALVQKLPFEIVLTVLEYASALSKRDALAVSLVCKRARTAAIPHVYRAITFSGKGSSLGRFLALAAYAGGVELESSLLSNVRELWTGPHSVPLDVLARCSGLERLAIEPQSFINYCSSRHGDDARLQSLVDPKFDPKCHGPTSKSMPIFTAREVLLLPFPCDWSELDVSNSFTQTCLQSITHLWLTDPLHVFSSHLRIPLAAFSNLTHLALRVNMPFLIHESDEMETLAYSISSICKAVPKLKMIVFVLYCTANCPYNSPRIQNLSHYLRQVDKRAFVLPVAGGTDADALLYPYFKASSSGEAKLWRRARRFSREGVPPRPQPQTALSIDFFRMQAILQVCQHMST
ncbi:hypothetical protein SCHPADRAFT_939674 [Schizopora paradoxa]|uniref:Uncharacterized protein n=1 Tax=Schizopora paradoxa TaxID=27342 RepID=A0A0H2SBI3_9AGAM|nr:hypothetical protein SCHPADRAFT_939674 [Schizopora paradoxa]